MGAGEMTDFKVESWGSVGGVEPGFQFEQWGAPASQVSTSEDVARSVPYGLKNAATGLYGLPGDVNNLAGAGLQKLGEKTGWEFPRMVGRAMQVLNPFAGSQEVNQAIEPAIGKDYEPQTGPGKVAKTGAELAGMMVGPGGLARKGVSWAGGTTGYELTGLATDNPWAKLGGTIAGGVLAPRIASRAITPLPASQPLRDATEVLRREGVTDLTAGQMTGRRGLANFESEMGGAKAAGVYENQLKQLTEAANRRMGESGTNVHDAVQAARPRIGAILENSAQKMTVRMDKTLGDDLVLIEQELLKEGLAPEQINRILAQRDNVLNAFSTVSRGASKAPDTLMTGTAFHNLIRTGSPLYRAAEAADSTVAHYAGRLREAIFDAAERTAYGQGTQPMKGRRLAFENFVEGRRQWSNMRALEEASSGAGASAAQGLMSPAAVRAAATNRSRSNYARGIGDFNELAKASNTVMLPQPNSGTAGRTAAHNLGMSPAGTAVGAGIGTAVSPGVGTMVGGAIGGYLPAVAGRAALSGPGRAFLANQAMTEAINGAPPWLRTALLAGMLAGPRELFGVFP